MTMHRYLPAHALLLILVTLFSTKTLAQEPAPVVNVEVDVTDPLDNPAVAAVLEQDRETPGDQLQVVATLLDLGYPGVAEPILKEIVDANLSEEKLVALADRFGSARLVRLVRQSRDPSLRASQATEDRGRAGAEHS